MNNIATQYYKTSYGELILGAYNNRLCLCDWRYRKMRKQIDNRIQKGLESVYKETQHPVIEQAIGEIEEYFSGNRKEFSVDLLPIGTDFQISVWNKLQEIPFGITKTYLDLSKSLGDEKAIRAVASANGANALTILIPCHRIIGKDGELVGYAGGLEAKKKLLQLENAIADSNQLTLF